ncbi:Reverse transcriptase [Phytophthora palmivora]|uniref:Reverse transcriptase n=1 Tax=Phytophthora palmivora TaxID=4796 RepID=A0A2P4Y373_9STRA|nr:Reverse transcriptase [Phytophthora palmivora]
MALEISPGESRGYWKYHVPDKRFKQSKAMGKFDNKKATLLFDSGAEVSILDATFARKVGCHIDENQTLECEGVGRSPYKIEGRTRLKITLAGSLVYFFDAWVGPPTGAEQFREKLHQLIKGLLSARMIRHSTSPWASPIVVIIKKNGIDIRLCIDYRLVNSLTRLMVYPMPLINDLLDDLDKVLWYCSLNMASGFWVVPMTDRARSISAFTTPFGLFEWNRMPFGLKNAPQIYQRLLDNALCGFLKIKIRSDRKDVFETGEPDLERNESVLGRRSYIDDILVTGRSWDALCEKVEKLLDACDEWNRSISVAKSFWGRQKVDYLGHRVSAEGLETHPKDLSALQELPFPTNLRSMQSFLGSLNYYSRFIEYFAIYASVLYELREADFYEITRKIKLTGSWTEAKAAFATLKYKIVNAPILQHFDVDRQPVVVVYASKWAISAALMQDHDGVYKPVTFTSRTLNPNESNGGIWKLGSGY